MEQALYKAEAGRAIVGRVVGDESIREKLKKYGIEENTSLTVIGKIRFGGIIVAVGGKNFVLTKPLAENIILLK